MEDEEKRLHDCSLQLQDKEKELSSTLALIDSLSEKAHKLRSERVFVSEQISNLEASVFAKMLEIRQIDRELVSPARLVLMVKTLKDLSRNDKGIIFRGPNLEIKNAAENAKLESIEEIEAEEPPRSLPKISIGHYSEFKDNY